MLGLFVAKKNGVKECYVSVTIRKYGNPEIIKLNGCKMKDANKQQRSIESHENGIHIKNKMTLILSMCQINQLITLIS